MAESEQTPTLRPATPTGSLDAQAMQRRISARLFPSMASTDPTPIPPTIGRYEILRRLGSGGMGIVYVAQDHKLDRRVALKLLRREHSSDVQQQLLTEARALAKLSHPNVVQVYEAEVHGDDVFLVMEFVDGETLGRWQQRRRRSRAEILDIYRQAGLGLSAAHASGLVHRDFKPSNVLIGIDGRVRVVDFGLASLIDALPPQPEDDGLGPRLVGTPGYLAPELLLGEHASVASDQFSYCVSLWEALSGARPFSNEDVFVGVEQGHMPASRGRVRPPWIRSVLSRGLSFDPQQRWRSMSALVERLERHRRARRLTAVLAPSLSLTGFAGALALQLQTVPRVCPDPTALEQRWGEAQAQALVRAAGSEAGARASAEAAADELHRYAELWSTTQRQVCAAHHEGALSAEGFDIAQDCLDRLRVDASKLIDRLDEPELVSHAERLTSTLVSPRTCMNVAALRAERGSALSSIIEPFERERGVEIDLALAAGRYDDARELALAQLERLPDGGAQVAATLTRLGLAERHAGEIESARRRFASAILAAERAAEPRARFHALCELAELEAYEFERTETATLALDFARAPLLALGEPPELRAESLITAAMIAEIERRHVDAETQLQEALSQLQALEAAPAQLAEVRLRLANSVAYQGRADEAMRAYEELLDEQRERLGPDHPLLGAVYFDIGMSWVTLERWADARPMLERALAAQSSSHGPHSQRVAQVLVTLAEVETELGHHDRAIELAERGVAIQSAQLPHEHPERDAGIAKLAWALLQGRQLPRSLELHRQLLQRADPADPVWAELLPGLHVTIAWLLCRTNACVGAWPHAEASLATSDPVVHAKARAVEVELHLVDGATDLARTTLNKLDDELAALPAEEVDDPLRAERAWLHARVAVLTGDVGQDELVALALADEQFLHDDQLADLLPDR